MQGVVEDPVLRQRYRFERSTDANGAAVLLVEMWVDPGGGVTPHLHPAMEERFEVLAGELSVLRGRSWTRVAPGEHALVAPGVRHAYRNRADEVAHVRCEARPPHLLQEFLEDVAALSRAGAITRHGLPRTPAALLQAAVLAQHYREMVVLGFPPMPPPAVQRRLFGVLARIAERRGYRARPASA